MLAAQRNRIITEITRLAQHGLTDHQIGARLGKHYKTIAYHRKRHGVLPGRSHKVELSRHFRGLTMNSRSYAGVSDVMQVSGSKLRHGLNASVPLACRGAECPYSATCRISDDFKVVGEACVHEWSFLATNFEHYCRAFQIDDDNHTGIVKILRLLSLEMKLDRCSRLTSLYPDIVIKKHDKWGNLRSMKLNPIGTYNMLLLDEKYRILKDLRTTAADRMCV